MLTQTIIEAGQLQEAMPKMREAGLARSKLYSEEREKLLMLDSQIRTAEIELERARKDVGSEVLTERSEIDELRRERVAPAESLAGVEADIAGMPLRLAARQQDMEAASKVGDLGLDSLIAALKRTSSSGTLSTADAVAITDHFESTLAVHIERVLRASTALRLAENDALHQRGLIESRLVRAQTELDRIDAGIARLTPIVEADDRRQAAAREEIDAKMRDLREQRARIQGQLRALGR